jgi:MYXO-CTERM domain-containing protein
MHNILLTMVFLLWILPMSAFAQDMGDVDSGDVDMAQENPVPPIEGQSVSIEFHSEESTLELFLRQGSSTVEDEVTLSDNVGVWNGTLSEGLWEGTVKAAATDLERTFTVEVGDGPVEMRVFVRPNAIPEVETESGCACATISAPDASVVIFPLFLLALFTRRRWVSLRH